MPDRRRSDAALQDAANHIKARIAVHQKSTSKMSIELQRLIRYTTNEMSRAFFGPSREAKDSTREALSDARDIIQDAQEDLSELWTEINDAMGELEKEHSQPFRMKRKRKQPRQSINDGDEEAEWLLDSEGDNKMAEEEEAIEQLTAAKGHEMDKIDLSLQDDVEQSLQEAADSDFEDDTRADKARSRRHHNGSDSGGSNES